MRKILYLIAIFTTLISMNAAAQTQLWSMTSLGGSNNYGTIFKMNLDGSGYTIVHSFDSLNGCYPTGSLLKSSSGKLYGMTSGGGTDNSGVLFSINPNTGAYSVLHNFDSTTMYTPYGSLIQVHKNLYGMTYNGGVDFGGAIFSFDTATAAVTDLADFDYTNGGFPVGDLLLASNGLLYGMSSYGGANTFGTLFSYDTATAVLTDVHDFDSLHGSYPYGSLIQPVSGGKLYGMTSFGGANQAGVIFSFNPTGNAYSDIYDFVGNYPWGNLIKASTGKLYGMTFYGGVYDDGILFSLNPSTYTYDSLNEFDGTNGFGPDGSLFQASNGKLYGMTQLGVSNQYGNIFSMDTTTANGNPITDLRDLSSTDGNDPIYSNFIEVPVAVDTIITGTVILNICAGASITVPYTANGTFIAGNFFTAQLSNATGSFASPTAIGTLTSTTSGNINAIIPSNIPAGVGYRIRVVSSNPVLTGGNNGANITINIPPTVTISASGSTTFCQGDSVILTASTGITYLWSNNASASHITATTSGNYSVTVTVATGCTGASTATSVTVNSLPTVTIIHATSTTFCQGDSVILSTQQETSYHWSNGATTDSITVSTSGSYKVTATNSNGCSNASTATTVTVNPLPTVTITSGNTTFCQGGSVTLTAMPSGATAYLWSNGKTTQSITDTISGFFNVTVTNSNGCSASAQTPTTITVNPLPTATITSNGPDTICQGDSIILTASIANSYLWSNNNSTQSTTVTTSGNYIVTVTSPLGCTAVSSPTNVTMNPTPSATISTNGDSTFCNGDSVILTAPAGNTYFWTGGATTQSITLFNPGIYSVTVTNSTECSAISNNKTITVLATPSATITPNGNTTFCQGDSVQLSSTQFVGGSYLWSNGATTQAISASTTGNYSITATNNLGCTGTASQAVSVNPTYSQNASVSICSGNVFTFPDGDTSSFSTVHTSNFHTAFGCDSSITTTLTVSSLITNNITATICQGETYTFPDSTTSTISTVETSHLVTASLCDSNIITTLTVNTAYSINVAASICQGDIYTFPDNSTASAATIQTSHLNTINNCDSAIITTLSVNPTYSIFDTVTICNGTTYTFPDNTTATTSMIHASFLTTTSLCDSTINTNLIVNVVDTAVTLIGNTLTAQAIQATYQWIDCSNLSPIPNEINQTFTPASDGSYAVIVTQNNCSDTSSCYNILSTGMTENSITSSIIIFPNPSNGNFILDISLPDNSSLKIKLSNVLGEVIKEENLETTKGIFSKEISMIDQPSGIYFLNLSIGNLMVNRKIVISH